MAKNRLALFLYCLSCPAMLCGQTTTPVPDSLSEPAKLTLPNGTPVLLRFAQPVVGLPQNRPMNAIEHAKVGDRVRLVVSSDIRAHDVVVVKKGSLAQATVTKVDRPSKYSESGLQLRFDWIQSVNEQEIPIRQKRKGDKSNKFTAIVFTTSAGTYVGFGLDHRTFSDAWRRYQMQQTGQQWTVVPPGTRIRAYVQGDFVLDSAEVSKALAAFPAQNPTATVTIYREKGPPEQQPHVICDEKDLGALNSRQYFVFELERGKHNCSSGRAEKIEFSVSAGEEFYLRLEHAKMSGEWKFKTVDAAVGEDAIAFAMPVEIAEAHAAIPKQP